MPGRSHPLTHKVLAWTLILICGVCCGCSAGVPASGDAPHVRTPAPSFYPQPGTYTAPQQVTITDAAGGTIYYTTDGSQPTVLSMMYEHPVAVSSNTTISAIAVAGQEAPSSVATGVFALDFPKAPAPVFSVGSGSYTTLQRVALSSSTPGAQIYFTVDNSPPTTSSTLYSSPIVVAESLTVRAIVVAFGFQQSAESDATYAISELPAPAPLFVPSGGTYTQPQLIRMSASVPEATIYYTTDGTVPTSASSKFTAAIPVTTEGPTVLRAMVTAVGFEPSAVSSATYTLNFPPAPEPSASPGGGEYSTPQNVTLSDSIPGAKIYYTLDGTNPTAASTQYTVPIPITTSTSIRALATAPSYQPSGVSTNSFQFPAPSPTILPAAGVYTARQVVTLSDSAAGARMFYTLDGSMPTAESMPYTGPIQVATSSTIRAVAYVSGFTASSAASATYTIYTSAPPVTISPDGGTFSTAQSIALSDPLAGAAIFYTLDGSAPSESSIPYTAPFSLSAVGPTDINAIAVYSGLPNSEVSSASFTITSPIAGPPSYTYKSVQIIGGGFVDGLYFHPAQQGLMYAHTDIGGAYRWNAAGGGETQWVPLNDCIGRFNNGYDLAVQSLAIDPHDAARLYLAVGAYTGSFGTNGAILASSDMGATFTSTPLPFKTGGNESGRNDGDRLAVDPNNGSHLYLGTFYNGLYESTDRASSWQQVAAFPITGPTSNPEDPEVGVLFEQFVESSGTAPNGNTRIVYVGVSSPTRGLYVSQDGGTTFTAVPDQPTGYYPNAEAFDPSDNILYITYATQLGCSTLCSNAGPIGPDAGQVWSYKLPTSTAPNGVWTNITPPQTTPGGGSYGFNSVAVDPTHPNVLVVTTLNKYYPAPYDDVFRSIDQGATWFNINTNAVHDVTAAPWVSVFEPGNWFNHFVIDPFDSNHALYGDGQTIWATNDLESADGAATSTAASAHGNTTHWKIGAQGIEETAVLALASPPAGPAHLLSEMYDLGGFTHPDLTRSPANGQQRTPLFTTGTSIDFAQAKPLFIVRVGQSSSAAGINSPAAGSSHGAYSSDGGLTWASFPGEPTGVRNGAGTIAVSADGSTIVWMPADTGMAASYSTDNGTTWKSSTGGPMQAVSTEIPGGYVQVYADRINPKKFYLFNSGGPNGVTPIYLSTDAGRTYSLVASPSDYDTGFAVSPSGEGDVWLTGYNGLYHSTNSGGVFTKVGAVEDSFGISFGAPAPAAAYPAIYLVGHVAADTACVPTSPLGFTVQTQCVYRSTDAGKTFLLINDFNHQYGLFNLIAGDPRVFGRVYFGTNGRGIIVGDSPN